MSDCRVSPWLLEMWRWKKTSEKGLQFHADMIYMYQKRSHFKTSLKIPMCSSAVHIFPPPQILTPSWEFPQYQKAFYVIFFFNFLWWLMATGFSLLAKYDKLNEYQKPELWRSKAVTCLHLQGWLLLGFLMAHVFHPCDSLLCVCGSRRGLFSFHFLLGKESFPTTHQWEACAPFQSSLWTPVPPFSSSSLHPSISRSLKMSLGQHGSWFM